MDNRAFKELVHRQGRGPSTKEVARRAVEEEEIRKRRKRGGGGGRRRGGGGGYQSSSDEDDDDSAGQRKPKRPKDEPSADAAGDDHKQKQKQDLASRYRDRARERREGADGTKAGPDGDEKKKGDGGDGDDGDPYEHLIVPHNKKGLDLALIRRERKGRQALTAAPAAGGASAPSCDDDGGASIVKVLPDMAQAEQTLRDYVASLSQENSTVHVSTDLPLREYVRGQLLWVVDWKDPSRLDAVTCGTAGNTLQHTDYWMAIDGHPSDSARAWEVPRQVTRSAVREAGDSETGARSVLMTGALLGQVDQVFQARRRLLEAMRQSTKGGGILPVAQSADEGRKEPRGVDKSLSSAQERKDVGRKTADPSNSAADDDDDDDIFGGIGEYAPQLALPMGNEAHGQPDER
jgi:hypothetical protein